MINKRFEAELKKYAKIVGSFLLNEYDNGTVDITDVKGIVSFSGTYKFVCEQLIIFNSKFKGLPKNENMEIVSYVDNINYSSYESKRN